MKSFSTTLTRRFHGWIDASQPVGHRRGVRYVSALGWVGLAVLARLPLGPLLGGDNPFMLFCLSVLLAAWFGGFGPGLLATLTSAVAAAWLWTWPRFHWEALPADAMSHFVLFTAVGALMSFFAEALRSATVARARAEEQARTEREQFRVTLASIGDAVIATDENGRVRFMNNVAAQLTGWRGDEAEGRLLDEVFCIVNEETRQVTENPVAGVLKSEKVSGLPNHTVLCARNGRERPIEDSAAPIRAADGTVNGVVLVFRDATARRKAEHRLQRQAEELEERVDARTRELREKVAELEAFSYSVSHDLRTPLRAIVGYSDLLLEELHGRVEPTAYSYLVRVSAAARRLDRLVLDVLTYSSIARGPLVRERVELDRFLPPVLELYPDWQEPKATIEFRRPLLPVIAYEAFLTQCLTNMVANAVKFVRPGVKPHVVIGTERRGECVRVWVEDNGIGVEPRERTRIFQMFERGTTDQRFPGNGIGLAVTRKAAERMGGLVGVEAAKGGGSRFWIELPAVKT